MLKGKRTPAIIVLTLVVIVLIGIFRPHQIDWTPTFSANDKIPYGNYILYHSLDNLFGKTQIKLNTQPLYKLLHHKKFENTSLIFIQNTFNPTHTDTRELLSFVSKGNDVFISAAQIGGGLADTFQLSQKVIFEQNLQKVISADSTERLKENFTNPSIENDSGYLYKKEFYTLYFDIYDSTFIMRMATLSINPSLTVLGTEGKYFCSFIRIHYGAGNIFLHLYPYAFTNYYILKPANRDYIAKCFSYLKSDTVIWDEQYKNSTQESATPLSFILSQEPLRWGYFTAVASLIIYILFNIKRRQRIIPVVEPYKNTSLEFTQTVGALYYHQSTHLDICLKKITYLLEFVRTRYNLNTSELTNEFAARLAYKSGISLERVQRLVSVMSYMQQKQWVSDIELRDLNNMMEYFKSNCQ